MIPEIIISFLTFIIIYITHRLRSIYVPKGFKKSLHHKIEIFVLEILVKYCKIQSFFNGKTIIENVVKFIKPKKKDYGFSDVKIETRTIENVRVKIYHKESGSQSDKPAMVYFHGGGFVMFTLEHLEFFLLGIVNSLDIKIISVEYRLAPEFPYPTPTNDCYNVTKHIIENYKNFQVNIDQLVLAGDSAGANAANVVVQRLMEEKLKLPKLQLLIYPWTQLATTKLPSLIKYDDADSHNMLVEIISLYMGIRRVSQDIKNAIEYSQHILLYPKEEQEKFKSYLDISKIPEKYKKGKDYYNNFNLDTLFPSKLDENNILLKDRDMGRLMKNVFHPHVSPLFTDPKDLIGQPKALFITLEWDTFKDEGLLFAERLKNAGVDVEIIYNEIAFHGILSRDYHKEAIDMKNDIVNYLKLNL